MQPGVGLLEAEGSVAECIEADVPLSFLRVVG